MGRTSQLMQVWMSPKEVAERWQLNVETIRRYCRTGQLPCSKTPGGGRVRIALDDVVAHEKKNRS